MTKLFTYIPLFLVFTLLSQPVYALSCVMPSLERNLESADIVFHGSVQKVAPHKFEETVNLVTILVETPILNVDEGDIITIYHKHWLQRAQDWEMTDEEQRHGIFALSQAGDASLYPGTETDTDIYYVGMCGVLYFPETDENLEFLKVFERKQGT